MGGLTWRGPSGIIIMWQLMRFYLHAVRLAEWLRNVQVHVLCLAQSAACWRAGHDLHGAGGAARQAEQPGHSRSDQRVWGGGQGAHAPVCAAGAREHALLVQHCVRADDDERVKSCSPCCAVPPRSYRPWPARLQAASGKHTAGALRAAGCSLCCVPLSETRWRGAQATNLHAVPQIIIGNKDFLDYALRQYHSRSISALAFQLTGWWKGAGDVTVHSNTHASGGRTASTCMHASVHSGITCALEPPSEPEGNCGDGAAPTPAATRSW